ncbi:MAG: DUF3786 domain-containing protein [Anaerolineaceae bacterium]|nr:MAG: DUF3786 domain-containing protein [Anaerolineaceae bacterium]
MTTPKPFPFKPVGHAGPALESRVDELRGRLSLVPPTILAERTGASYLELGQARGEFHLALLGVSILLTYPDFRAIFSSTGAPLPAFKHALLLYYFLQSDNTPPAEKWISFSDLPEGRIYAPAFQGYTGDLLAKTFLLDMNAFGSACRKAGGIPVPLGDVAYRFNAFPRMDLGAAYHLGDDDFPSTCNLLFDANAGHYLPAEACAILGSSLTQMILRAKN